MIRIQKTAVPERLSGPGKNARRGNSGAYTRNPRDYQSGTKKFDFKSDIYGHHTVKQALIRAQHKKCAFCEQKVTSVAFGDVEHFRPKGGFKQQEDDVLEQPGYYWLAYEWDNLFLSCQICNQRFKKNLFPLEDSTKRARSHKDEVSEESPLFIHPEHDDPEAFISFHEEIPFSINGNRRGIATITSLGLEREDVNELRRDHLAPLKLLYDAVTAYDNAVTEEQRKVIDEIYDIGAARTVLTRARRNKAAFSSMVRANLP